MKRSTSRSRTLQISLGAVVIALLGYALYAFYTPAQIETSGSTPSEVRSESTPKPAVQSADVDAVTAPLESPELESSDSQLDSSLEF